MATSTAARGFAPDTRVRFREGYRPTACTLPETMVVFISDRRQTTVRVDGKARFIATVALEKA